MTDNYTIRHDADGNTIHVFGKPGDCGAACDFIDSYPAGSLLVHWGAYENAIQLPKEKPHD